MTVNHYRLTPVVPRLECNSRYGDVNITYRSTGAVSNRMKRDLAIKALDMAVAFRQPAKGCIHHTDRGSQYCSNDYQKRLSKYGLLVLMSGKGNCYPSRALLRNTLPGNAWLLNERQLK